MDKNSHHAKGFPNGSLKGSDPTALMAGAVVADVGPPNRPAPNGLSKRFWPPTFIGSFLIGALGGLAIWKSLNMSLMSLFSLSPKGSRCTKALLSILGGSLPGAARGGIWGGGLGLCCPPGIRFEDGGGKMLVWKGFPKVEFWVQDPLVTGVAV